MAYETGTASSWVDLVDKLFTFAVANGWTSDDELANQATMHKGSVYVSWNWATPGSVAMYQSLGYTGGGLPGTYADDSGNGYNTNATRTDTNLRTERCIFEIGNGPYPSYHFFENDSSPAYIHVVVEKSTGVFRHFGFGEVLKFGTFTGGEYVYGHYQATAGIQITNSVLLDGFFDGATDTEDRRAATIHCEGLPGQAGSSKWGQVWGNTDDSGPPTSTDGNAKINIAGGSRSGPVARSYGMISPQASTSGLIPMWPIVLFYVDNTNQVSYPLGYMADVRQLNIGPFAPGEEVIISSDTWIVFPYSQKISTGGGGTEASRNGGIAYKKVTV